MLLSRWAFVCDVCPTSRRTARNDLQGGSALPIRSHCGAVWGVSGHNFIWDAHVMPHKNICNFAGDDRDGYLHNKSSHAHGKTANNFSLYFYIFPCITSQAMLGEIFQIYYQRTTCIRIKSCCYYGGLSPPRSVLPSFRSSVFPCGRTRHPFHKVHPAVFEFRPDEPDPQKENPKVVLGACLVVRPLGFGACAFGIEGFGGNRKAKKNVGFDLACVGRSVEKAELNRSGAPNVVEVDGAVAFMLS